MIFNKLGTVFLYVFKEYLLITIYFPAKEKRQFHMLYGQQIKPDSQTLDAQG